MSEAVEVFSPGLDGVIAGETAISSVAQGSLLYRGYDVAELAEQATFEECAYLLLYGELPDRDELGGFRRALSEAATLPNEVHDVVAAIPRDANFMDVLRTAVSMAGHFAPAADDSPDGLRRQATRLIALIPPIIGARMRILNGLDVLQPRPGLSHAAQLLYLLNGQEPPGVDERLLNLTLILYAEHEYNASTFAARVCTSTRSDMVSAVVAAIATLKGPLHGGANEEAMLLMDRFRSGPQAQAWVEAALARRELVMGFGHRVYKNGDHRARILERHLPELADRRGEPWRLDVYHAIKNTVWREKKLHPNLDFPCGLAYHLLGLPIEVYTPLFVASRVSGWCAHVIEQHHGNRIIRPRSRYTGPPLRPYAPLSHR